MARTLKLVKYGLQNVNFTYLGAYRLKVEASDPLGTGADPNVFLFNRSIPDPETDATVDYYTGVCSPVDMSVYPVGEPVDDTPYPMFRSSSFEIDLPAVLLANKTWGLVQVLVGRLLLALDALELLVPLEEVYVGDPVPTPPPASDSSASSISA